MKKLTTLCLTLSLMLTGCNTVQPGTVQPATRTTAHSLNAPANALISLNVSVYEYHPATAPELTARLPEKGERAAFTPLSPSLEEVITQQTLAGKLSLTHQLKADTPPYHAVPFSVSRYNVIRKVEGNHITEENQYGEALSMAIRPMLTTGARNILLDIDMAQSDGQNTIAFSQRLSLPAGKKLGFITPISPDTMSLIIIAPSVSSK